MSFSSYFRWRYSNSIFPVLVRINFALPELSPYWSECRKFYKYLNVKGKIVYDIGDDFGTSPMFFIQRGADYVYGMSLDDAIFSHDRYSHQKREFDFIDSIVEVVEIRKANPEKQIVLKADCEGCEWSFTKEFIEHFDDWVIALHAPVRNKELYNYIWKNGEFIGRPVPEGPEFAVYGKVIG